MDARDNSTMKYTLSSFTVSQEHLKKAKRALAELVADVRRHEPHTLYLVFREEDQPVFFCLMAFADEAAERAHAQTKYVGKFARKILPLCDGKPYFTDLGFFASTQPRWSFEPGAALSGALVPLAVSHPRRSTHSRRAGARGSASASTR